MSADWAPDIFEYVDFRLYLADYYDAAKNAVPAFSYRYFSRRAGFSSPNYLKMVMDGERNLTAKSAEKMIVGLQLDNDESEFFRKLVGFSQAKTSREKNEFFEEISASRRFRRARRIDADMFEYLSRWYYPAIREMAARTDFQDDPHWISLQLFPRVSVKDVRDALRLLFELGLLERDQDGNVVRGEPTLTTGHEVRSLAIGNYHRQMLERGAESIETVPREKRDISGMTMCVTADTIPTIKERIHAFRESLLELCEQDEAQSPDHLYQLSIILFPLSVWSDE